MPSKRIQLDDFLEGIEPYTPHLSRTTIPPAFCIPSDELTHAAAKTAKDILKRNGVTEITITDADAENAEDIFLKLAPPVTVNNMPKPAVILQLEAFMAEYDWKVVKHADQIRMVVTNKLLELATNRDPRVVLKAVELLGKLADVGMFVDKQEITMKNTPDADLKKLLQEKLGLLIEGEIVEAEIIPPSNPTTPPPPEPGVTPLPPMPKITSATLQTLMNT